jgi:hypothetical protein
MLNFFHLLHKMHAQDEQIRSSAHRVLTLRTVPQYHPHATETIATLGFAQRRKIALKKILEGADHLDFFDPLTTTQVNFI